MCDDNGLLLKYLVVTLMHSILVVRGMRKSRRSLLRLVNREGVARPRGMRYNCRDVRPASTDAQVGSIVRKRTEALRRPTSLLIVALVFVPSLSGHPCHNAKVAMRSVPGRSVLRPAYVVALL